MPEEANKEQTEEAKPEESSELSDEQLDEVAGGGNTVQQPLISGDGADDSPEYEGDALIAGSAVLQARVRESG